MSDQTFEIRCPGCGSIVPPEASGCQSCAGPRAQPVEAVPAAATAAAPEIGTMRLKEYHRLVRANYVAVEGPRVARAAGGVRLRAYLPFLLLVLGLLVGGAMASGRL